MLLQEEDFLGDKMPKPTGPTDPNLQALIKKLRRNKEYARLVRHLAKPRRSKDAVNVSHLNKVAGQHESVAVPGKVLSAGEITKAVNVYAWQFSAAAKEKIEKAGGKCFPLELLPELEEKARVVV